VAIHQLPGWPGLTPGATQPNQPVETSVIMRARSRGGRCCPREIEALLPPQVETHPLGCHRRRVPDRLCFRAILIRLVTGASWVDVEAILDHQVSDTTLRARSDEWICARDV
jgi:hypothetical protein